MGALDRGRRAPRAGGVSTQLDWTWLYWYFVRFSAVGSPFDHSSCFDIKTAFAVKGRRPISKAGRSQLVPALRPDGAHTHHAKDDAIEQAEIFARLFEWEGVVE